MVGVVVVLAQGRDFLSSSVFRHWALQRDSVAGARASRMQRGEAATRCAQLKHSCVAAGGSRRTGQRLQRRGLAATSSVVCCPAVLSAESPCDVGRCRPAEGVQSTAAGPGWQGSCAVGLAQRTAAWAVVDRFDGLRFQEREVVGRWPGLARRLCQTDYGFMTLRGTSRTARWTLAWAKISTVMAGALVRVVGWGKPRHLETVLAAQ